MEGGQTIIARYRGDSVSESSSSTTSKRGKRVNHQARDRVRRSLSSKVSPSKFLEDQGGIEGIIQEAARGVYSRGEKWGVAKALRGAYQGLQSASNTPTRLANAQRWSLDSGSMVADDLTSLTARINALEQRNKALAKLLERSMEDLWVQQREFTKEKAEVAADALSLAIAKIQFVQVYLENTSMPLPTDDPRELNDEVKPLENVSIADFASPDPGSLEQSSPTPKPIITKDTRRKTRQATQSSATHTPVGSPSENDEGSVMLANSIPKISIAKDDDTSEESTRIRPALAQSSFSWILGEDQRKSDFVAATPFSTEKERARGKAGFLFGDGKTEGIKHKNGTSKDKHKTNKGEEEQEEAITLKSMKAAEMDSEQ